MMFGLQNKLKANIEKFKKNLCFVPAPSLPCMYSNNSILLERHLHIHVYCYSIHRNWEMESIYIYNKGQIDTDNVWVIDNEIYLSVYDETLFAY